MYSENGKGQTSFISKAVVIWVGYSVLVRITISKENRMFRTNEISVPTLIALWRGPSCFVIPRLEALGN